MQVRERDLLVGVSLTSFLFSSEHLKEFKSILKTLLKIEGQGLGVYRTGNVGADMLRILIPPRGKRSTHTQHVQLKKSNVTLLSECIFVKEI